MMNDVLVSMLPNDYYFRAFDLFYSRSLIVGSVTLPLSCQPPLKMLINPAPQHATVIYLETEIG